MTDSFVANNFEESFIYTCIHEERVHTISSGDPKERNESTLHVKGLSMMYMQQDKPLCVLYSTLSALSLYGDAKTVSHLLAMEGEMLAAGSGKADYFYRQPGGELLHHEQKNNNPSHSTHTLLVSAVAPKTKRCARTELLFQTMRCTKSIKWLAHTLPAYEAPVNGQTAAERLHVHAKLHRVLLLQLLGADGLTTHSICVVSSNTVCASSQPCLTWLALSDCCLLL